MSLSQNDWYCSSVLLSVQLPLPLTPPLLPPPPSRTGRGAIDVCHTWFFWTDDYYMILLNLYYLVHRNHVTAHTWFFWTMTILHDSSEPLLRKNCFTREMLSDMEQYSVRLFRLSKLESRDFGFEIRLFQSSSFSFGGISSWHLRRDVSEKHNQ